MEPEVGLGPQNMDTLLIKAKYLEPRFSHFSPIFRLRNWAKFFTSLNANFFIYRRRRIKSSVQDKALSVNLDMRSVLGKW